MTETPLIRLYNKMGNLSKHGPIIITNYTDPKRISGTMVDGIQIKIFFPKKKK